MLFLLWPFAENLPLVDNARITDLGMFLVTINSMLCIFPSLTRLVPRIKPKVLALNYISALFKILMQYFTNWLSYPSWARPCGPSASTSRNSRLTDVYHFPNNYETASWGQELMVSWEKTEIHPEITQCSQE